MQHCDGGRVGALVRETVPASSTDSTAHLSHLMQESGLEPLFKCNTRPALIVKDHTTEIDMDLPLEGTARELLIHRTYLMNIYYVPEDYKKTLGASLVAQWLRICLLMQGTRVRALVWEDPTCHGAAGPVSHNC